MHIVRCFFITEFSPIYGLLTARSVERELDFYNTETKYRGRNINFDQIDVFPTVCDILSSFELGSENVCQKLPTTDQA